MATFLSDTMTGTDGDALTAHTPGTGSTWVKHPASGGTATIKTNRVCSDSGECDYYNDATPGSADYYCAADMVVVTNSIYSGLLVRMDTSATTWYGAGYDNGSGNWEMFKAAAGSFSSLTGGSPVSSGGPLTGTYTLKLEVSGTGATVTCVFTVNGTPLITGTDTTGTRITATGKAGFYSSSSTIAGYHFDNMVAADGTGAVGLPPGLGPAVGMGEVLIGGAASSRF